MSRSLQDSGGDRAVKKYGYIDALRGWAVLGVVFTHTVISHGKVMSLLGDQGARGVQLFFLVSALTLFMSHEARMKVERRTWLNFYVRRFFRIAPLFYCAIAFYTLSPFYPARYLPPEPVGAADILLTSAFLHGIRPDSINAVVPGGWTITVEMTFYALIPLLYARLRTLGDVILALICSLAALSVLNGVLYPMAMSSYPDIYGRTVHNFFLFWFPAQLPVFLLGILLYRMILAADPKKDGVLAFPLLALAGLVIVGSFKSFSFLNLLPQHVLFSAGLLLFAFSLYLRPRLLFVNPVTIFLGKISFSLYLVHFALLDPMETLVRAHSLGNPDLDSLLYFILVLIPASGLAWITHRWIELPGIRLGSALIRRWEKTAS